MDHEKLWKALRKMGIPDHLTCLLRNLYAGQEATVKTLYVTTYLFKVKKRVRQGCLLSSCLFNLHAEHIMRNMGLDELQAVIKIDGRNMNSLRYAHDIILTSLVAQTVKCLSTMRETWVQSQGWEDPLEKEMAIYSSTIAWKIPWTEEPGRLQSMGLQRVRHD